MRKTNPIIFLLLITITTGFSQFVIVPIPKTSQKKSNQSKSTRKEALQPLLLPFWDDFSFSNSKNYPHDTIWQNGKSVRLNFGEAIEPPTLGVATFDGLDSLGKPYSVNDPLLKGYADSLVSRAIRMDTVPANQRDSVFFSFFYEPTGNGEPPDPGDYLQLDFRNKLGEWETVALISDDGTLRADTFNIFMLKIDSPRFYHNNFQFRFRNHGRLSGPYDTWHIDYVYLNSHRSGNDISFPDRALSTPLTSLFKEYWAIPKRHFMTDIDANLNKPSFDYYNLSSSIDQPVNYTYYMEVIEYKDSVATSSGLQELENNVGLQDIPQLSRRTSFVGVDPPPGSFDPLADSFKINLKLAFNSADNIVPHIDPNPPHAFIPGDYDSIRYGPINFRSNDTTWAHHTISNYYAYDDGSAEYGIGLNQPGAQAAYRFDMKTADPDTVVAVDIYFPRFGDETNQIVQLSILGDTTNNQQSVLYQENIQVNRSEMDTLRRYVLNVNTVGVQGHFYVSWKQSSAVSIPIGWDKNTDSGDKIFFNLNGAWEQNITEHGSIMIHPVFGKGGFVTGMAEAPKPIKVFPNPNSGTFYLSGEPDYIEIVDLAGKAMTFTKETNDHQTRIEMTNVYPGLYVLKTYDRGKYTTQKVLVRP